jgi:methyl-accepting chemotaxis protein
MKWFANLTIGWKLFSCFAVIITCLGIVIACAISTIEQVTNDLNIALEARQLHIDADKMRLSLMTILLNTNIQMVALDDELGEAEKNTTATYAALQRLKDRLAQDAMASGLINDLETTLHQYCDTRDREQIPLVRAHQMEKARTLSLEMQGQRFERIARCTNELADHASSIAKGRTQLAVVILAALGTAAVFVAISMSLLLHRLIATPIGAITRAANRLALGELEISLPQMDRDDEVGALAKSFQAMAQSWRDTVSIASKVADGDLTVFLKPRSQQDALAAAFEQMVGNTARVTAEFKESVLVVNTAVGDILVSVNQFAAGAAQTAAAAIQTTTTVEEVRQTSMIANQKAKQVAETAQKTAQVTQDGRKATEDVIEGMKRIREQMDLIAEAMIRLSEKSQSISEIITTVDDLAKQSNLLAVNASIEAAAAGEFGKGFGVVAQEVKNLAEQSKQSTAEVRHMLTEMQQATNAAAMATELGGKAVDSAINQSQQAGRSIAVLAASVQESALAAKQIAVSNNQQLAGVDQVAHAMSGIKEASSEHLQAIRHVETAAHRLNEIGIKLKTLVDRYDVWDAQSSARARAENRVDFIHLL